jgi:putative FmdB family regulatory protein
MPIYEFSCTSCGTVHERLLPMSQREIFPKENSCECGGDLKNKITAPAHTPSGWGDMTGRYGVNGYFSKGLGGYVDSKKAEEKIMRSRGFIPESDLPKNFWEDETSRRIAVAEQQDKYTNEYKDLLASGKSKEEAIAETFSTERIMSGELEKVWGTKPKDTTSTITGDLL